MLLHIPKVLTPDELAHCHRVLDPIARNDAVTSMGYHRASFCRYFDARVDVTIYPDLEKGFRVSPGVFPTFLLTWPDAYAGEELMIRDT